MSRKKIILRPQAERDVNQAVDYYFGEGGFALAGKWADAVESALRHIGEHPGTGSPRYAVLLKIPGLRCWPVKRFPYLAFYIERETELDVWRVMHQARDIPTWLDDDADNG